MYVYFRYDKKETVMVVLNKNKENVMLDQSRYAEILNGKKEATDVVRGTTYLVSSGISVPARTAMVFELK